MKQRILILGANGMAGNIIMTYLEEKGYEVYKTTRENDEDSKNYYLDVLGDSKQLEKIVAEVNPTFVINCIGVLNNAAETNKPAAVMINSYFPHYVDSLSNKYNFKFIHISTDCVYDGKKGDYTENDLPDAASFYGRSKALGEVNNERNLTFRTSIVGPDINEKGIGLFNWFMKQNGEIKGYSNVIWTGVTTLELAKSIEKAFSLNINGLYHLVNNEKIGKYDLLLLFKKYMDKDITIIEDKDNVSKKTLVRTRTDFNLNLPSYEQMVAEMAEWIYNHPEKYETIIPMKRRGGK